MNQSQAKQEKLTKVMQCFGKESELTPADVADCTGLPKAYCSKALGMLISRALLSVERYKIVNGRTTHIYSLPSKAKPVIVPKPEVKIANDAYARALTQKDLGGVSALSAESLGKGDYVPLRSVNYTPSKTRFFTG